MIVERYLAAVASHQWDDLRECIADDVVRIGPFHDEYSGADAYVAFLSSLMPNLPGYAMNVHRVTYAGNLAFAELSETVAGVATAEALVFALDDAGRISRIDIFIKTAAPR